MRKRNSHILQAEEVEVVGAAVVVVVVEPGEEEVVVAEADSVGAALGGAAWLLEVAYRSLEREVVVEVGAVLVGVVGVA